MRDQDAGIRARVLELARARAITACDVLTARARGIHVSVRMGEIEDIGGSETFGIGLRVFDGHRVAYGSSADSSPEGLAALVDQVAAMAHVVPEDPFARLSAPDEWAQHWPITGWADTAPPPTIETLKARALEAEKTGLAINGITKSDGASASWGTSDMGLSSSAGFDGAYSHTGAHLSLALIGGQDQAMERDYDGTSAVCFADLATPQSVGKIAAARTLSRLNPRCGKTGTYPVLFDKRVSNSLLRSLARAISGPRLAKKTSFLNDALGSQVLPRGITVVDDPLKPFGLRSSPFDSEGCASARRLIVEDGILCSYFLDLRSAARLNMKTTGHASRGLSSPPAPSPSNLYMEAGTASYDDLLADMREGFVVTELMGASISLATGDYSRGAAGFWVEGGRIAYPVSEMTIAGNLRTMLAHIQPANDLEFHEGIDAPSLLVPSMIVASR